MKKATNKLLTLGCLLLSLFSTAQVDSAINEVKKPGNGLKIEPITPLKLDPIEVKSTEINASDLTLAAEKRIKKRRTAYDKCLKFETTKVPEKWKNESAVILYQQHAYYYSVVSQNPSTYRIPTIYQKDYAYYVKGYTVESKEVLRRRIKIQDQSALESFSTFYFNTGKGYTSEFHIVNAEGKKVEVSLSEFEENTTVVPDFYQLDGAEESEYRKTAIPGLQIGDIVEYTYTYTSSEYYPGLVPTISTNVAFLSDDYPIVAQEFLVSPDKEFRVNMKELNGAPPFDYVIDIEDRSPTIPLIRSFDQDREAYKEEIFEFKYRNEPFLSFQVQKYPTDDYTINLLDKNNEKITYERVNTQVFNDDQLTDLGTAFVTYTSKDLPAGAEKASLYLKSKVEFLDIKKKGTNHNVKLAHDLFQQLYFEAVNKKVKPGEERQNYISAIDYYVGMAYILRQKGIDFRLIMLVPRSYGDEENMLTYGDIQIYMMVEAEGEEPLVFSQFSRTDNFVNEYWNIDGTKVASLKPPAKLKYYSGDTPSQGSLSWIKIETKEKPDAHSSIDTKQIFLGPNFDTLYVKNNFEHYGILRQAMRGDLLHYDYHLLQRKKSGKKQEARTRSYRKFQTYRERAQTEARKSALFSDFPIADYTGFEIVADGSSVEALPFKFKEEYKITNCLHRAGDDIILDAGTLIGDQIALQEEDYERKGDIWLSYKKTFTNRIEIEIPAGYLPTDLSQMNTSVENELGGFTSSAIQEGNKIIIETKKEYKQNAAPKSQWPEMTAFLDAAWEFNQKKIVFVKQ